MRDKSLGTFVIPQLGLRSTEKNRETLFFQIRPKIIVKKIGAFSRTLQPFFSGGQEWVGKNVREPGENLKITEKCVEQGKACVGSH